MFDFINGAELLDLCNTHNKKISDIMINREKELFGISDLETFSKMEKGYSIMLKSIEEGISSTRRSMGGIIGGEAKKMLDRRKLFKTVCGSIVSNAVMYSMAVMETNSQMRLIVASPTAGSSGVIPGVFKSICEEFEFESKDMVQVLFNAAAIGYIVSRNAAVSGAAAGCQAEVGVASAMAASAIVELMGGSPEQCLIASSISLSNLLGLVCDPIAGLVEEPCQKRNAIGASNALISAEIALSGVNFIIPFDEMVDTMYNVGINMPSELRETAMGGIAIAPSAPTMDDLFKKS